MVGKDTKTPLFTSLRIYMHMSYNFKEPTISRLLKIIGLFSYINKTFVEVPHHTLHYVVNRGVIVPLCG